MVIPNRMVSSMLEACVEEAPNSEPIWIVSTRMDESLDDLAVPNRTVNSELDES